LGFACLRDKPGGVINRSTQPAFDLNTQHLDIVGFRAAGDPSNRSTRLISIRYGLFTAAAWKLPLPDTAQIPLCP